MAIVPGIQSAGALPIAVALQTIYPLRHLNEAVVMKERELFLAALDIEDPAARQAHLKAECADDAAVD